MEKICKNCKYSSISKEWPEKKDSLICNNQSENMNAGIYIDLNHCGCGAHFNMNVNKNFGCNDFYPKEQDNRFVMIVKINDGFSEHEFSFNTNSKHCINDFVDAIEKKTDAKLITSKLIG